MVMSCHVMLCMYEYIFSLSLSLSIYIYIYICIYIYISIDIPVLLWPITCTVWFTSQSTLICNIHSFMNGFVPRKFHNSMGFPMLVCCQVSPLTQYRRRLPGKHFVFHWFQISLFQRDIFYLGFNEVFNMFILNQTSNTLY